MPPRQLALARVVAAHRRLHAPHCFSHESAALVWGLPVWQVPAVTDVRTTTRPGSRAEPFLHRHCEPVPAELVAEVNGLPVTSLALTAADCARTLAPLGALVVLDAALRAGADRDEIADLLAPGRRGVRRARALLSYADAGAESAWETATRLVLLRAGVPRPATQVEVVTRTGTYWADLGIPQWRVLVEYDGRVKYTDPDAVFAEKLRQDAITETSQHFLRVTSKTLPRTLATQVLAHAPATFRPTPRPELGPLRDTWT